MGMESVLVERLRISLEECFQIDLADTAIFDYPNISALSEYIVKCIPFEDLEKQNFLQVSKQEKTLFLAEPEEHGVVRALENLSSLADEKGEISAAIRRDPSREGVRCVTQCLKSRDERVDVPGDARHRRSGGRRRYRLQG